MSIQQRVRPVAHLPAEGPQQGRDEVGGVGGAPDGQARVAKGEGH